MYRQQDTELNAVFRDTSGHRFSVTLQLMLAAITFLAFTLFHVMTDMRWLAFGLIFYIVPFHLTISAMREVVSLRRAQAHKLDGYDDLPPPPKSHQKMTYLVYGGAMIVVSLLVKTNGQPTVSFDSFGSYKPDYGMLSGFAIFAGLCSYNIYVAIWRPKSQPNLSPSRHDAISQTKRAFSSSLRDAAMRLAMTALIIGGSIFYFVYWSEFGNPQPLSLL